MKASLWTAYGPPEVLQIREVEQPTPGDNQVLIKIQAAGVTAGDCEMRRLALPLGLSLPIRLYAGLSRPTRIPILGQELAGEVVEVGQNVTRFQTGDLVFGTTGFGMGAYAEYLVLPETPEEAQGVLARRPANLAPEEVAVTPTAGLEALHYLQEGGAGPGSEILVIGGGGSIGTFSIQLAKHLGAVVTAVDSPAKGELMRSLGADRVLDYTREKIPSCKNGYDLVIDVVGKKGLYRRLRLLKPGGSYFLGYARFRDLLLNLGLSLFSRKRLRITSAGQDQASLDHLTGLLEKGILTPRVDRVFPLEEAAQAHQYVESGEKQGHVALQISQEDEARK